MTLYRTIAVSPGGEPQHVAMTPEEEESFLADLPAEPAPAPLPRLLVADRLTDEEVAVVATLQAGTVQQQRWWLRWVSADTINPANPEVVAGFEAVFGESRAAELLAPED